MLRLYSSRGTRSSWTVATLASAFKTSKSAIRRIVEDAPRGRGAAGLPGADVEMIKGYLDQ